MEHLDFTLFSNAVNKKFQQLAANNNVVLMRTTITGDELYEIYLNAYDPKVNTIFRERRHYDGNYDKNYIRRIGNVVAIHEDGTVDSIWNVTVEGYFQEVADAMHKAVVNSALHTIFLSTEPAAGSQQTPDNSSDIVWTHFHSRIPAPFVVSKHNIGTQLGQFDAWVGVFTRGLTEFTTEALETVKELIAANSIYRGAEFKSALTGFATLKASYTALPSAQQPAFIYYNAKKLGPTVMFKNTVIGTLVEDISSGMPLDKAVAAYEKKVAPENYKRPTALVTPRMIEEAQAKIEELGLTSALNRRFATLKDIDINNVLFTSRTQKALNVFDDLKNDVNSKPADKTLSKVEEISLDHFLQNIIPTAQSVEVLFENKHTNNLMSLLTAVETDAAKLFKWDNTFSWSYNGEVTDSLRDKVQALGGRVDGVLRFSHSWNHGGTNQSLMDLHVFGPDCKFKPVTSNEEIHNFYPAGVRVGWNHRKDSTTKGVQDVDHTSPPGNKVPVENITFPTLTNMPEGKYTFKIHNWAERHPNTSGFKAEIEFGGNVFEYEYARPLKNKQWITVAEATLKDGKFTIEHKMDNSASSKNVWGLDTNRWVTVNNILLSPNAWNQEQRTGNEHLFFIIDNCKNPDSARGIYNEFLRPEFEPNRKVFELLGDKTKAAPSSEQASGLGFSSTRRDKVTVRVTGKTKRTFVINL